MDPDPRAFNPQVEIPTHIIPNSENTTLNPSAPEKKSGVATAEGPVTSTTALTCSRAYVV